MPAPADPKALLESFYAAFARKDWRHMGACYHPEAVFRDAVFNLEGKRIEAMWRMLLESGKDMRIEAEGIAADGRLGKARWTAWYTFSSTGRMVRNEVEARFEFKDGLIYRHLDRFGFWRWAMQALGPAGFFLGWMPRMQQTVQARARAGLDKFVRSRPEYGP